MYHIPSFENAHILSEEDMSTDKIYPIISNGVATMVGKDLITKRIGTVTWSWTDDEGQLHKKNYQCYLLYRTTSKHTK